MKAPLLPSVLVRQTYVVWFFLFSCSHLSAANLYWNGANVSASPANGGTGTWSTTNAWRSGSDTGSQVTWVAATGGTDSAILAGTAGTITLGTSGSTNFTGADMSVNTTGYTLTSGSSSRNLVFTGTLSLANNVAVTLDLNNAGGTWSFGTASFGSGSSLTMQGAATINNANRLNLTTAGTISGGGITLAGTGAGVTGFVSTASSASGGVTLNTNITNNSATSATMLGATGSNLLTYGGQLSGSAHLQISAGQSGGAGIVVLNSSGNNFTGGTYLNSATNSVTRIGVNNALPSGTTIFFGQSAAGGTAETGGSIDLNGKNLAVGALDGGANTRGVANNTGTLSTLTIGKASGSNTFAGNIGTVTNTTLTTQTNNIAVIKTGASSQTFSATNTYTGGTEVQQGTLVLGNATDTLADTGAVIVSGGTLSLGANSDTVGAVTLSSGSITGSGGTLTASSYALHSGTVTAILAGSGTVTKTTGGTVTLAAGNTFTGKTTISGGFIAGSGESIFGANPGSFTADQITLNGGGIQATGSINFSSNRGITLGSAGGTFDTNGNAITLSNVVTGSGGLIKNGTGTLSLAASHTFTGGVTINAGVVQLNNSGGLNSTTPNSVTFGAGVASGTKLQLNGNSVTVSALNTNATPGSAVVESGSGTAGTDTLTVNNTASSTFAGVMQDSSTRALALTKQGSGTLVLSGTNTYTGSTILGGGNLQVGQSGSGKTGTGSVTVNGSGAVLSGTGTVDGSTTSVILGTIKPGDNGGDGTGTLNTKTLVFTPVSSTTVAELQIASASSFDVINITGDLTLNNLSNILVNGGGYTAHVGDSFTLIDWSGVLTLNGFSTGANFRTGSNADANEGNLDLPDISGIGLWQISNFSGSGALTLTVVVPEPARGLLLVIGVIGLTWRRRR